MMDINFKPAEHSQERGTQRFFRITILLSFFSGMVSVLVFSREAKSEEET
jgi:hypothetical protein